MAIERICEEGTMGYREFLDILSRVTQEGFEARLNDAGAIELINPKYHCRWGMVVSDPVNAVCAVKMHWINSHSSGAAKQLGMTGMLYGRIMEASRNDLLRWPGTRKALLKALALEEQSYSFCKRLLRVLRRAWSFISKGPLYYDIDFK